MSREEKRKKLRMASRARTIIETNRLIDEFCKKHGPQKVYSYEENGQVVTVYEAR